MEALRTLAVQEGVSDAASLGRAELISRLAHKKPSLVERAREAVAHAVDRVGDKAHGLAERVRPHHEDAATEARARTLDVEAHAPAMGVPSSTVHPHAPAPPEPTSMLDFEELPETYGVDEC